MGSLFSQQKQPLFFHIGISQAYPSNLIKTTTYNIFTFLPLATLVQFKRLANVYFLITAVLQFIPAISPLSPISAIAPLIFVLTVSLIRSAIQQIGKYRYDRQANSSLFQIYKQIPSPDKAEVNSDQSIQLQTIPTWQMKRSDELQLGNIIKIKQGQRFPADLVILFTSNQDGKAYIQTSSLDGEKNLKVRNPLASTKQLYQSLQSIHSIQQNKQLLTIQEPNQQLYTFNGMIQYTKKLNKPLYGYPKQKHQRVTQFLKIGQFLYRDSVLRNTSYIVGVIVGVGKYTKSMMNNTQSAQKMSKLQQKVNFYMIFIFLFQLSLIILCGFLRVYLFYEKESYVQFTNLVVRSTNRSGIVEGLITSCSYFILLNTMIPISLLVTIEIVKFGQGIFIGYDKLMSKKDIKLGCINSRAFRFSINEQLGMVQYLFTDKTGTLTKNQMVLKQLIIGDATYSSQSSVETQKIGVKQTYCNNQLIKNSYSSKNEIQKLIKKLSKNQQNPMSGLYTPIDETSIMINSQSQTKLNTLMLLIMSICHQCLLVKNRQNKSQQIQYQGSSPDEITLVDSAARLGFKFIQNCYGKIKIQVTPNYLIDKKQILQFTVENIFQFNSDRKRMSIIVSTPLLPNQKLLFCKGADSIIDSLLICQFKKKTGSLEYICYNNIKQKLIEYSKIGLRTLLFGLKIIPNSQYFKLNRRLALCSDITNKNDQNNQFEKQKQKIMEQMETGLMVCGATAVQDKLQDEVQEVIKDLIRARIKVCMLTGDKLQTAENIAKSCNLFQQQWKIIKISEGSSSIDIFHGYCEAKQCLQNNQKYGILIQGAAIASAIQSLYFTQMFQNCSAAVCCRITPKNKAEVVNFAKKNLKKLVLSIGDGANDVPMIQSANLGIGLYGNEGMNAVQASDFAIPEFKCLWRLLFVHGRWNYLRVAELIKYFFFKNVVFTLCQLWFAYLASFSGTSIYNATYLVLYNTIFTGGPVLVRALLEQDLNYIQIIKQIKSTENTKEETKKEDNGLNQGLLDEQKEKKGKSQNSYNSANKKKLMPTQVQEEPDQRFHNQSIRKVSKLWVDSNLKKLYPILYSHSQEQQSLNPKIFSFIIGQSIIQSFCIFLTIYLGIQSQQIWIFSISLYSVVMGLVTIKICYTIVYWTWLMVGTILLTSIIPYILFVYIMSLLQPELYGTFVQIIKIPDFYLCLFLALGLGAFLQGTFNVISKYYFPTSMDIVRKEWKKLKKQEKQEIENKKKLERTDKHKNEYFSSMKSRYLDETVESAPQKSMKFRQLKQIKSKKQNSQS